MIKTYREGTQAQTVERLRRFYYGMPMYATTYVAFIAFEFSLYETLLRKIELSCNGRSLLGYLYDHVDEVRILSNLSLELVDRTVGL